MDTSKYADSESDFSDVSLDSDETKLEDPDVSESFEYTDVIFSTDFCVSADEHKSYPGHQEIPISSAVTIRYTVSMSKSSITYKKSEGYYNNLKFYLYSTQLKKMIGKPWRTSYRPNKKELAIGGVPKIKQPNDIQIMQAITELLQSNANINRYQSKKTNTGMKTVDIFASQELFVFWLTRYRDIAKLDGSSRTDETRQNAFAKVCRAIGNFNLQRFCQPDGSELDKVCEEFAAELKKALRVDKSTSNTNLKMQIVRFALSLYLAEQKINPKGVMDRLIKHSVPRKSDSGKISDNMRPRSLTIERYSELFNLLQEDESDESKGLQLMLFLGLTAEEVCGLDVGDLQSINGYYKAEHLRIAKVYRKEGKEYTISYDEEESSCRFVPLPFPLNKLFSGLSSSEKEDPLLTDNVGKRMKPDTLEKKLKDLLKEERVPISVKVNGKKREVDLAFLPSSYRASARYYWHYYCGLTEGEIHNLGGLTPPDTLSGHYVDFNNMTEQYRMLKQLEHGIALLTRETEETKNRFEKISNKRTEISAGRDTRVNMNLMISGPVKISLSSWRGLRVRKEEDT